MFPLNGTLLQSTVAPFLNVTVPWLLGFVPLADVTVAVNVSESPYVLGLVPLVRASAVDVVRRAKKLLSLDVPPAASAMPVIGLGVPVLA